MSTQTPNTTITIELKDLEKLIRRAVRDEFAKLLKNQTVVFHLKPDMPIYDDMAEIAQMKKRRNIKVYSRQEAFGD